MRFGELLEVVDEVERELPEGVEFVYAEPPPADGALIFAVEKHPVALCGVSLYSLVKSGVFTPWGSTRTPLLEVRLRNKKPRNEGFRWVQVDILPEHTPELLKKILLEHAADLAE